MLLPVFWQYRSARTAITFLCSPRIALHVFRVRGRYQHHCHPTQHRQNFLHSRPPLCGVNL